MTKQKDLLLNNTKYTIVENYKECLNLEQLENLFTYYFYPFDYVLGEYSYGKLRLKGFYEEKNKKSTSINSIKTYKKYIEEYCAFNCPYFLIKKEISVEK